MYLGKLKFKTIDFIIDNLCSEAREEMILFFKQNAKRQAKEYLKLILCNPDNIDTSGECLKGIKYGEM